MRRNGDAERTFLSASLINTGPAMHDWSTIVSSFLGGAANDYSPVRSFAYMKMREEVYSKLSSREMSFTHPG